ncbi:MAG: MazG family protein, partial [Gammaproteobacteria bacterium]|nr:MazG family protein [Gammaproteobacteria bacterium]
RHPHVFGEEQIHNASQQTDAWEQHKAEERSGKNNHANGDDSALSGVPLNLPALARAQKLGKRAARVGFDWPDKQGVHEKINEELEEFRAEVEGQADHTRMQEEFGDILFALANLARHLDIDPEKALRDTNAKFERRFRAVEKHFQSNARKLSEASLEEMDQVWNEVKAKE